MDSGAGPSRTPSAAPHVAPTFLGAGVARRGSSRGGGGAVALARTHSHKDLHDADVSHADGEFGAVSRSHRQDHAWLHGQLERGQHKRSASGSSSRRPPKDARGAVPPPVAEAGAEHDEAPAHESLGEELREYEAEDAEKEEARARELAEVKAGGTGEKAAHAAHAADGASPASTRADVDVEKAAPPDDASSDAAPPDDSSSEASHDPDLVSWDGPDDPRNPRNWSLHRRWAVIAIVSSYTFLSPLNSSMIAPALPLISQEFDIRSSVTQSMTLSVFVLAYAIGPLFLAPLSEMWGRKAVLQLSNLFFIVFTIACAVAPSSASLIAFRFLAGLGGSAPLVIGGGVVGDLMSPDERGTAMSVYSLAPLTGPSIGPIIGGWVVQGLNSWRISFWITFALAGATALIGLFILPETYAPRILADKTKRLRKETGNEKLHTIFMREDEGWRARMARNLVRPFILIGTQLVIQLLASFFCIVYGTMYLLLTTWSSTFVDVYGESVGIASLNYLSLAIGFTLGGQFGGRAVDRIYHRLKKRNGGQGKPEFKLPLMMFTGWMGPAGLLLYGWSAQYKLHWIAPNIGGVLFAAGMLCVFNPMQNYIVDSYSIYAASAISAVAFLRSLAGFGFPLFAPSMFDGLGLGWGCSVLALALAVVGLPAPFLLFRYGERIRAASQYCAAPQG